MSPMPTPAAPRPSGLRHVTALRYVTPLREGGSLPGLMEADDLGTYVVKYSGAGQGLPVLVAEVVSGELARGLGLPVPELVTVELDPALGASEPDQEVQDLLRRSPGWNLGMDFLPGALDLDPGAFPVDPGFAGRVLWFDALVGNVDRTWRNVNMLRWHGAPYLIDHGATLTFHHGWTGPQPPEVVAAARAADAVTFTSSSTVTRYLEVAGPDAVAPVVVCIGPVTAQTARDHGLEVDAVADDHSIPGLVDAVVRLLGP